MDGFDRKTAARVWGRVQGRAVESGEDLPGVLLQVHLENKLLQFLVRSNSGRKAELLHGLIRSGLEQEQILQGIHRLRYGKVMEMPKPGMQESPAEAALRRCCLGLLQRNRRYEALRSDEEFGSVFAGLAARCAEDCLKMMQILGG